MPESRLLARLTNAAVEKRGVGTTTDPAVAGLMLRVRETRTKGLIREWRFRYKLKGRTGVISLGNYPGVSLASARGKATRFRDLLQEGIDPRRAMSRPSSGSAVEVSAGEQSHAVTTLISEFIELHLRKRRRRPEYAERILIKELANWAHRDARTIQPREVIDLLDGIVARPAPVMANRVAGLLSQMFRYGIHRRIVDTSPVQLLFRPGGKERPRQRALDDAELAALLENVDQVTKRAPRTGIAIRLILLTAVRRGELIQARWSEIDLSESEPKWSIPGDRTKTGATHIVPLTEPAAREFELLKRLSGRSPWIYPAETGDLAMDSRLLTRSVARHLKSLGKHGVQPFTAHDLRRTVRTGLAKLRIRPDIAERVLGHAQPDMVATYDVHQYLDEKREALTKWANHLATLRPRK